jgi:hypothetical protein
MGKASSNKKVARAAGIGGGRTYRRNTPWGYFGIIALIVVLGLGGIFVSRNNRTNAVNNAGKSGHPPVVNQTPPWHEGYGVYECGKWASAITSKNNPEGIYTSQPGIITIQPKTDSAAGKNATLGKFASAVGLTVNAAELQVPGGKQWLNGDTCEGSPGHVYVMQFPYPGSTTGQLYNGNTKACKAGETGTGCGQLPRLDPRDVPLGDQELVTIAFVPADKAGLLQPPPAPVPDNLSKLSNSSTSTTTTTAPASTTTTKPATSTTTKA